MRGGWGSPASVWRRPRRPPAVSVVPPCAGSWPVPLRWAGLDLPEMQRGSRDYGHRPFGAFVAPLSPLHDGVLGSLAGALMCTRVTDMAAWEPGERGDRVSTARVQPCAQPHLGCPATPVSKRSCGGELVRWHQ